MPWKGTAMVVDPVTQHVVADPEVFDNLQELLLAAACMPVSYVPTEYRAHVRAGGDGSDFDFSSILNKNLLTLVPLIPEEAEARLPEALVDSFILCEPCSDEEAEGIFLAKSRERA